MKHINFPCYNETLHKVKQKNTFSPILFMFYLPRSQSSAEVVTVARTI